MPASPLDSAIYGQLFSDPEMARLFSDSAELRAWMLVEGALAKVQGDLGLIPEVSAKAIHRASLELQLDPGGLAAGVAQNAVPIPGLVTAFRDAMQAPEHSAYIHWGATSQDIVDTGLALRLRQALSLIEARLEQLLQALATLAEGHAELPMMARTYGQPAVPTSFGAVAASWGRPMLRHLDRLETVRADVQKVSLSGAAGTLSAMGPKSTEVRAALAKALGLTDPGSTWHEERDGIAALAGWLTGVLGSLGKMGEDLILMSGNGEVTLTDGGGSSTMPQKANPVLPSVLVAAARMSVGMNAALQSALPHRQQRDGAAWLTEWLSLPQLVILTARAVSIAEELANTISPDADKLTAQIDATNGMIFAEALSFALAEVMPRPEAQAAVKALVQKATDSGLSLPEVATEAHPDLPDTLFSASSQLGSAADDARAFARAARERRSS